jgi:hypothetical protein
MKAVTRRVWDMCVRVLSWTSAHPDDEAGITVLIAQLQALVARIAGVVAEQRSGLVDSRAASARKIELQRTVLSVHVAHLAEIGGLASREQHELAKTFLFKPNAETYAAFQSAARTMFAEAQTHKEVLVKYGLSGSVLEEFGKLLDEFDAAVKLGHEGRTIHTAATRELDALTTEARKIVRAMDARNRQRFQNDRQALEQWISARTVLGIPRGSSVDVETPAPGGEGGQPNAGGEVKPAA